MKKILTTAMAALTLVGAGLASATPAAAHDWNGYGYGRHDNDAGVAIAGGIVGLALGAAIASHSNHYGYGGGYYSQPYYSSSYGYGSGYGSGYSSGYGYGSGYGSGYGQDSYYGSSYGSGYSQEGYSTCTSRRSVWDPYAGRYITRRYRYAC